MYHVIKNFNFVLIQIDDYSLVKFLPLDISEEDSISDILLQIDNAIQYGEDLEPREIRVRLNKMCSWKTYAPWHTKIFAETVGSLANRK